MKNSVLTLILTAIAAFLWTGAVAAESIAVDVGSYAGE